MRCWGDERGMGQTFALARAGMGSKRERLGRTLRLYSYTVDMPQT